MTDKKSLDQKEDVVGKISVVAEEKESKSSEVVKCKFSIILLYKESGYSFIKSPKFRRNI